MSGKLNVTDLEIADYLTCSLDSFKGVTFYKVLET